MHALLPYIKQSKPLTTADIRRGMVINFIGQARFMVRVVAHDKAGRAHVRGSYTNCATGVVEEQTTDMVIPADGQLRLVLA